MKGTEGGELSAVEPFRVSAEAALTFSSRAASIGRAASVVELACSEPFLDRGCSEPLLALGGAEPLLDVDTLLIFGCAEPLLDDGCAEEPLLDDDCAEPVLDDACSEPGGGLFSRWANCVADCVTLPPLCSNAWGANRQQLQLSART